MTFNEIIKKPPYIIAEVGSNWTNLEDCLLSIRAAQACGADAVKFQIFDDMALYGYPNPWHDKKYNLPEKWLPILKYEADFYKIDFMCSAFSPELAKAVDPFVKVHKVASCEMYHTRLLETLNSLGRPVILSTAASTEADVTLALRYLRSVDTCLMYCVGAYPAKMIDLRNIRLLHDLNGMAGYSDHSLDVATIPTLAVSFGAQIIEKHFTAIGGNTPDSGHSLNLREFKMMVESLRGNEPPAYLGPQPDELDIIMKHKRRLKVIAPIKAGETLKEGINYGAFRSLKDDQLALNPLTSIDSVNGFVVTKDLESGDPVSPEAFR